LNLQYNLILLVRSGIPDVLVRPLWQGWKRHDSIAFAGSIIKRSSLAMLRESKAANLASAKISSSSSSKGVIFLCQQFIYYFILMIKMDTGRGTGLGWGVLLLLLPSF
jgi:hypothetical protein